MPKLQGPMSQVHAMAAKVTQATAAIVHSDPNMAFTNWSDRVAFDQFDDTAVVVTRVDLCPHSGHQFFFGGQFG